VFSEFSVEACPALHGPENPLSTLELSKTAEKPPNHDNKHYMFQISKLTETPKPQNQNLKAKETPIKTKTEKEGICGRNLHAAVGSTPTPAPNVNTALGFAGI